MSPRRSLIIGGHNAEPDRYPYFASFDHWGGGVLIAPDIILTAGHCNPPLSQPVVVKVGRYSFSGDDDNEVFSLKAIHRHPDYYTMDWGESVNDFNLFKITGFSKQTPIKINRNPDIPKAGDMVTVIGEGSTSADEATFTETASDTLQEVELKIISNEKCSSYSDPARNVSHSNRIFDSMVCTSTHNRDGCAFDSGSPLILEENDEDVVVGLVSWGIGCADPIFPSVNARISFATDWIDKTVCEMSDANPADLADFGCSPQKHGWIYNLFHQPTSTDVSSAQTFAIGSTTGVQIAHPAVFFAVFAVAIAVAVTRKFRLVSTEFAEREPLHHASETAKQTYEAL